MKRKFVVVTVFLCLLLCGTSFAADLNPVRVESLGLPSGHPMEPIVSAVDTLTSILSKVWSLLTSNPYLTAFLALGLLSAGFGIFLRAKRVSRR